MVWDYRLYINMVCVSRAWNLITFARWPLFLLPKINGFPLGLFHPGSTSGVMEALVDLCGFFECWLESWESRDSRQKLVSTGPKWPNFLQLFAWKENRFTLFPLRFLRWDSLRFLSKATPVGGPEIQLKTTWYILIYCKTRCNNNGDISRCWSIGHLQLTFACLGS